MEDRAAVKRRVTVVLASGGFEASREWRRHLGEGWEAAKVRGGRYNTGDGIRMALEAGAARAVLGRIAGAGAAGRDG